MKDIKNTFTKLWWWFGRFLYHSKVVKYVAIVFIWAGTAVISPMVYNLYNTHFGVEDVKPSSIVQHMKQKNDQLEVRLTKWIYDHSDRISRRTSRWIAMEAMKTNKSLLIVALATMESTLNPTATSKADAKGLTQVMWKTWGPDLIKAGIAKEERDLYDVDISIRAGDYVLDRCLNQSNGDISKTLDRYLGAQAGWYKNRITENLSNLYIATIVVK